MIKKHPPLYTLMRYFTGVLQHNQVREQTFFKSLIDFMFNIEL